MKYRNALFPIIAILGLIFLLLFTIYENSAAQEAPAQPQTYLLRSATNGLAWQQFNTLPYTVIESLCWDETNGWGCDWRVRPTEYMGLWVEGGSPRYEYHPEREPIFRYTITEFPSGRFGSIFENDYGCWIWWFEAGATYGSDGNPHPELESAAWINCIAF